jgi:hypothetical protein
LDYLLPECGVGGQYSEIPYQVSPGLRNQGSQASEKFHGIHEQAGAAVRRGPGQVICDGVVVKSSQAAGGKGRAGAIPRQALQGVAVPIFDVNRPVEGKASFVFPGQHVVYVHGVEAAVALEVAQDSYAELFLERADCVRGQVRGGEEPGLAVRVRSEDSVGYRGVEVGVFIQRRDCSGLVPMSP